MCQRLKPICVKDYHGYMSTIITDMCQRLSRMCVKDYHGYVSKIITDMCPCVVITIPILYDMLRHGRPEETPLRVTCVCDLMLPFNKNGAYVTKKGL